MDNFRNVSTIERKLLCSFLLRSGTSNDEVQLWASILKPVILDQHISQMENLFIENRIPFTKSICPVCNFKCKWTDNGIEEASNAFLKCTNCLDPKPLLKFNFEEAVNIILELLETKDAQILATSMKKILKGKINAETGLPYAEPKNPFRKFLNQTKRRPNYLKFGSTNLITIADIYENYDICEFPILYIADTSTFPTRFYFIALKYKSDLFNPMPNNLIELNNDYNNNYINHNGGRDELPLYQETFLIRELCYIVESFLKPRSTLVLGKRLQELIPESFYNTSIDYDIDIMCLRNLFEFDIFQDNGISMDQNWGRIVENAIKICEICLNLAKDKRAEIEHEQYYTYLNLHFITAIWILSFHDTPFESMLYHLIFSPQNFVY